jgi:hypothetical protein
MDLVMPGTIWSKFFWSDWANDPKLRLCSLAAQGLWMRCLCIAALSDPTGYISVNGRPLGVTDIARMAGVTETEAAALISDLDRNGVFSRDRNGRIYSRRMVRDAKLQEIARKNGKKGGNPKLRKRSEIPVPDNPPINGQDKTHKPEARVERATSPPVKLTEDAASSVSKYAFEHGCIRLTEKDLRSWEQAFAHIPVRGELLAMEEWLSKQSGNWFVVAKNRLNKLEREAMAKSAAPQSRQRRREKDPLGNFYEVGDE